MKQNFFITLFLFIYICTSAQTAELYTSEIIECISSDNKCDCLNDYLYHELIQNRAFANYYFSYFNCDSLLITEYKVFLEKSRELWDSMEYNGYRYLNSYFILSTFYSETEELIDSSRHYNQKIFDFNHDGSVESLYYYHEAFVQYAFSFDKYNDSYAYFDFVSDYVGDKYFRSLSIAQKVEAYALQCASIASISEISYLSRGVQMIDSLSIKIDSLLLQLEVGSNEYKYLSSLKTYLNYSHNYCLEKLGLYNQALRGYIINYDESVLDNDLLSKANTANSIANMYLEVGKLDSALIWINQSIAMHVEYGESDLDFTPYYVLGKIYKELSQIERADSVFNLGLRMSAGSSFVKDRIEVENIDEVKSLEFYLRYRIAIANNSILNIESNDDIEIVRRELKDIIIIIHDIMAKQKSGMSHYDLKKLLSNVFEYRVKLEAQKGTDLSLFCAIDNTKYSILRAAIFGSDIPMQYLSEQLSQQEVPILQFAEFQDTLFGIYFGNGSFEIVGLESINKLVELKNKYLSSILNISLDTESIEAELRGITIDPFNHGGNSIGIIPSLNTADIPFDLLFNEQSILDQSVVFYLPSYGLASKLNELNYDRGDLGIYYDRFEERKGSSKTSHSQLPELKFAKIEASSIQKIISDARLISDGSQFLSELDDYGMLHFTGHFIYDYDNPFNSRLVLRDTLSLEYISLDDVYNSRSRANMVVLSTCQSGSGKGVSSDGILSLTQSFFHAGAKSVISTLWSINDQSSSFIMKEFYKELKKGKRKDEALRQAKLTYLAQADPEYQHPYYWAAFVAMGDMSPLFDPYKNWKIGGGIFTALLIGGLGFRKYTSRKFAA